ncbi:MAG: YqhA family protein [Pseudomonadota bacterium]
MSPRRDKRHSLLEEAFETTLFNCRFLTLLAVLGSLLAAMMMFLKGCIEIAQAGRAFYPVLLSFQPSNADDKAVLLSVIPAVDYFLFATVLLIFSMGIYELFISEIDPASRGVRTRPNWLNIKNLDDLKSYIGKVIMMILIVNFFKQAFDIDYKTPTDLLFLGGAILLVALALYVSHNIIYKEQSNPITNDQEAKNETVSI